jgi:uncharacterized protein (DUF2141 family)
MLLALLLLTTDAALAGAAPAPAPATGSVVLEALGFRNDAGKAQIAIYRAPEGFPVDPKKAARLVTADIRHGEVHVTLDDLPPGPCAIALFHDENVNYAIDTNWLGIPKEGLGVTNDAKGRFGPPSFKDSTIQVQPGTQTVRVHMVYL